MDRYVVRLRNAAAEKIEVKADELEYHPTSPLVYLTVGRRPDIKNVAAFPLDAIAGIWKVDSRVESSS